MDLARSGSNDYSGSWHGPPASAYDTGNDTHALQVFLTALQFRDEINSTTTSTTSGLPASQSPSLPVSKGGSGGGSSIGAIVGGVIGGVAIVLVALVMLLCLCRRRPKGGSHPQPGMVGINPYVLPEAMVEPVSIQPAPNSNSDNNFTWSNTSSDRMTRKGKQPPSDLRNQTPPSDPLSQNSSSVPISHTEPGIHNAALPLVSSAQIDRDALLTDLVMLLNERRQNGGTWDDQTSPPVYS